MSLPEILSNALGGSVVGSVAAATTRWHDSNIQVQLKQLQNAADAANNAHELEMAKLTLSKELAAEDTTTLQASYKADAASYSVVKPDSTLLLFVDAVRGLVRPILTAMLVLCCVVFTFMLLEQYNITVAERHEYLSLLLQNLVSCAGLAIAWWFGSRPTKG